METRNKQVHVKSKCQIRAGRRGVYILDLRSATHRGTYTTIQTLKKHTDRNFGTYPIFSYRISLPSVISFPNQLWRPERDSKHNIHSHRLLTISFSSVNHTLDSSLEHQCSSKACSTLSSYLFPTSKLFVSAGKLYMRRSYPSHLNRSRT